jgi:2-dehydropantoate 2-reductase
MVKALPISEWHGKEDLTIITVKQYQLEAVIEKIKELESPPKSLLFLQNGMGHLKLLEKLPVNNLYIGSVEHGAYKENAFTVSHNGEGKTNVAVYKGDSAVLREFTGAVSSDFPFVFCEDYYKLLVNKLIVNAVINPLTAMLQVKNGELIKNQFYLKVLKNLFAEVSYILNLEDRELHLRQIIEICQNTEDNRSSMLKDIEAGRDTEVDAILGFLLEEAIDQKKKAPQVENFYYLIKGKEIKKRV